jgi:hypothetical protein
MVIYGCILGHTARDNLLSVVAHARVLELYVLMKGAFRPVGLATHVGRAFVMTFDLKGSATMSLCLFGQGILELLLR